MTSAIREDASSDTFKEIDTLERLLHEDGRNVEDRCTMPTYIVRELFRGTQHIHVMSKVIQHQLKGHGTLITQKFLDERLKL